MQIEVRDLWNQCLNIIKNDISEQSFATWFAPIVPLKFQNNTLTIQVPSQFFYEWLEEKHVSDLRKAIDQTIGRQGMLEYSIVIDKGDRKNPPITFNLPPTNQGQNTTDQGRNFPNPAKSPFELKNLDSLELDSYLIPKYTFDKFIEGDCNRLGRAAGMAVANKPGLTAFNPLMIYGGVGLGKTHLVHAIGNRIKEISSNKSVLYVSSERFINQYVDSAKNGNYNDFLHFYQMIDVLIVDDVQFFAKKEKTQEIFFQIFNYLHQNGKQLILTSDRAPKDLKDVDERLLSRFKWGLSADLQNPDFETRISILEQKMYQDGIKFLPEVIEYVANKVDSNIRELEGALISLIAQASLNRKEIDLEMTKKMMKNFVKNSSREISIEFIQKLVSDYFGVSVDLMKSKTRKREIVQARQITMFLSKSFTKNSLKTIGEHFGGRDHTTVIHSCQTVKDLMDTDNLFKESVLELQHKVQLAAM